MKGLPPANISGDTYERLSGAKEVQATHPCLMTVIFFFPGSCLVVRATWSVIASEKNKN